LNSELCGEEHHLHGELIFEPASPSGSDDPVSLGALGALDVNAFANSGISPAATWYVDNLCVVCETFQQLLRHMTVHSAQHVSHIPMVRAILAFLARVSGCQDVSPA